jgi:SnoaL-like domain
MPWVPEVFSAPALAKVLDSRGPELVAVPYFDGLMAGETDALAESFAGVPEVHVPLRGRVKGTRAFEAYVDETSSWLSKHNASVEDVEHVITDGHGFEEVVLHLNGGGGRVELPVAVVADRRHDGRIEELRIYFSNAPLGRQAHRPPVLQRDPDLRPPDVVGEYQDALAAGDVDAVVAAFEPDGLAREPAGTRHLNGGDDGLRRFYERLFSNGGGIALESCAVIDDGRACALEYNVARWGETQLAPEAGFAVYERGPSRRLAAARTYDDADFRLHPQM